MTGGQGTRCGQIQGKEKFAAPFVFSPGVKQVGDQPTSRSMKWIRKQNLLRKGGGF